MNKCLQQGILFKKKEGDEMMLCDELKPIFIPTRGITGDTLLGVGYYPSNAVDEAIAELKCELSDARADNEKLKEALKIKDDLLIENGAEIGSLKADNESLRKAVGDRHDKYCNLQETIDRLECKLECVKENKDKELRATNRAMWLARAKRALEKIAWFKLWNASISTMNPEDGARQEFDKWKKALGKFLAKAEEYK